MTVLTTIPASILAEIAKRGLSAVVDEVQHREAQARSELLYWKHIRQTIEATIPQRFDSPLEQLFWETAQGQLNLLYQYQIGPHRIDFAVANTGLLIEIDGHDYHKTPAQRTHDASRDRELTDIGYTVYRFTGSEVKQDPARCVAQIAKALGNGHN